jgi:hypothetical protein
MGYIVSGEVPMLAEEVAIGVRVRYSGTGTTGNVVRIEQQRGSVFAELDSTNLLYRIDQLVAIDAPVARNYQKKDDIKKTLEEERKFVSGSEFQETLKNIDQSCEGGG